MNIELKISPELLAPVAAWLKREKAFLGKAHAANSEHTSLTEKRERLVSEIAKLEDRATEDDAAIALAGKREQLAAVERKLESFAGSEDDGGAAQKQRLSELRPLLTAAVGPFVEAEIARVTEIVSPFFRARAAAESAARQSDYVSHLNRFAFSAWERVGAASALSTVETVLRGALPPFQTANGN